MTNSPSGFKFSRQRRIWSFQVVVLKRTAKKYTKKENAHAIKLLYCSLYLLFANHLIVFAVPYVVPGPGLKSELIDLESSTLTMPCLPTCSIEKKKKKENGQIFLVQHCLLTLLSFSFFFLRRECLFI